MAVIRQDWMEANEEEVLRIAALAGIQIKSYQDVGGLAQSMKAMLYLGCKLPQWAMDAFNGTLQLQEFSQVNWHVLFDNDVMRMTRGGTIVTQIVNNMVAVANGEEAGKNFKIYSAHDMTVAALAFALGVDDQLPMEINYGDLIMVDLVQNGSAEPKVEVIYLSKEAAIPQMIPMNVPGCGFSCTLTAFRAATSDMMVEDYDALCRV